MSVDGSHDTDEFQSHLFQHLQVLLLIPHFCLYMVTCWLPDAEGSPLSSFPAGPGPDPELGQCPGPGFLLHCQKEPSC